MDDRILLAGCYDKKCTSMRLGGIGCLTVTRTAAKPRKHPEAADTPPINATAIRREWAGKSAKQ